MRKAHGLSGMEAGLEGVWARSSRVHITALANGFLLTVSCYRYPYPCTTIPQCWHLWKVNTA